MNFMRLHHTIASLAKRVFRQLWTNAEVPPDISVRHDFHDGKGKVPAAPVDTVGQDTSLGGLDIRVTAASVKDTVGQDTSLGAFNAKVNAATVDDTVGQNTGLGNFEVTDGEEGKIIPVVVK